MILYEIGNSLATDWKQIGNTLATDWEQICNKLGTEKKKITYIFEAIRSSTEFPLFL